MYSYFFYRNSHDRSSVRSIYERGVTKEASTYFFYMYFQTGNNVSTAVRFIYLRIHAVRLQPWVLVIQRNNKFACDIVRCDLWHLYKKVWQWYRTKYSRVPVMCITLFWPLSLKFTELRIYEKGWTILQNKLRPTSTQRKVFTDTVAI